MRAIIDIETKTYGLPDPEQDEIVMIGVKPLGEEPKIFFYPKQADEARRELRRHKILIGYNIKGYDIPILSRFKLINAYNHVYVDEYGIISAKENYLPFKLPDKKLSTVLKTIGLSQKTETPLQTFQKPPEEWTVEEKHGAIRYLKNDLKIEEELFCWLDDYFKEWKEWLSEKDVLRYSYLTSSDGVYTYKAICKLTGMKEEYGEWSTQYTRGGSQYEGGLVVEPTVEEEHGDIICLDFASMYPHAYIQGNLYSHSCNCCTPEEKWTGGGFFPLKGAYCTKKRGKIEEAILKLYKLRQEYKKKGDRRQYALKIMINTMYGISGNPTFKNVFSLCTASDCTLIGRTCLQYARERLNNNGYQVLYSDTDSAYIKDPYGNERKLMMVVHNIVEELKSKFPFPSDTFDFKIDERIKHIWFYRRAGRMKKKHYAYVTDDGKVVIKGLPIIKRDRTELGKRLLEEVIKPMLKQGVSKKTRNEWDEEINKRLREDYTLAGKWFYTKPPEHYKDQGCLPAMISLKYGPGKHFLIPNKKVGVGKGTRYCTMEEYERYGLTIHDLILNKIHSELREFTTVEWKTTSIYSSKKVLPTGQEELFRYLGA